MEYCKRYQELLDSETHGCHAHGVLETISTDLGIVSGEPYFTVMGG
jgi:hypothetical protein